MLYDDVPRCGSRLRLKGGGAIYCIGHRFHHGDHEGWPELIGKSRRVTWPRLRTDRR